VAIPAALAVGKYEVTFDEWQTCIDHGDCPEISTSGWGKGRQPVINVSFSDAQHYVAWLSRITGRTYRLLSEAEREYAARAHKQTLYFFGNDEGPLGQYAWFAANSGNQTHPVGEKRANPFALHDVYGNVSEWVEDCFNDDYRGAPSDGCAWVGENCTTRVVRGGYWLDRASALRSASRDWAPFDKREDYIDFRIARPLQR
jgi:formylglycine-generating enzyme required for sulfatase activity